MTSFSVPTTIAVTSTRSWPRRLKRRNRSGSGALGRHNAAAEDFDDHVDRFAFGVVRLVVWGTGSHYRLEPRHVFLFVVGPTPAETDVRCIRRRLVDGRVHSAQPFAFGEPCPPRCA